MVPPEPLASSASVQPLFFILASMAGCHRPDAARDIMSYLATLSVALAL